MCGHKNIIAGWHVVQQQQQQRRQQQQQQRQQQQQQRRTLPRNIYASKQTKSLPI
jgi:transcription initiation factor TFIID subunit TAF12